MTRIERTLCITRNAERGLGVWNWALFTHPVSLETNPDLADPGLSNTKLLVLRAPSKCRVVDLETSG
jgi:hypothetical protein